MPARWPFGGLRAIPAGRALTRFGPGGCRYHMKRTTLMVDEELLDEAVRETGVETYSAAVNKALRELVDRGRARRILELRGSGLWEGELAERREDRGR